MNRLQRTSLLTASSLALLGLAACGGESGSGGAAADPTLGLPKMSRPADWSEARAALGKQLFFDERMSSNGEMSCRSCHYPENAWTDGKQFSQKVTGAMNTRNSPTLFNVGYQERFYWDGRAPSMEANIGAAWKGHMCGGDEQLATVVEGLNGVEGYVSKFQEVYGVAPDKDNVVDALCSFVRTLQAGGTPFDRFQAGDKGAISADAQAGWQLFQTSAGCISCHTPPLFTDLRYHNAGIGMAAESPDLGAFEKVDGAAKGSFKTPTMRGVAKSGPYFHDGSVATLAEAVKLMHGGGLDNPDLDPILKAFQGRDALTDAQVGQIVAFLESLTPDLTFEEPKLP